MNNIIKNIPIAISGLLLAIFSLVNLYDIPLIKLILFSMGIIILTIILSKIVFYKDIVFKELNQLVVLSTSGTFSMSLMIFSTFLISFNDNLALIIWISGVILHVILIMVFTYRYVFKNLILKTFMPVIGWYMLE